MGQKGIKVQDIESTYNVKIKFPDRNARPSDDLEQPIVNGDGPNPSDVIKVTGKPENCEQAIQALKDNEPVEYQMDVPAEYHKAIIGPKGSNIKSIGSDCDVYIEVPGQNQQEEYIVIRGAPAAIEVAKIKINDEMRKFDEEKEERRLKSYKITLEVDPEFHPKIIGKKGAVITKIRNTHQVQINCPKRDGPEETLITIQGYENDVHAARDEIMTIVNGLKEKTKEEFEIDNRVHSRLIGARGKAIKKVMDTYNVEIRFPRSDSPNPNLITVRGDEENVLNAKDHLLNLEEEYLQDINENEVSRSGPLRLGDFTPVAGNGSAPPAHGFVVTGAPWENNTQQSAPDTNSTQDFPSFGGGSISNSGSAPSWGPRK